jgi:hypothetical protein
MKIDEVLKKKIDSLKEKPLDFDKNQKKKYEGYATEFEYFNKKIIITIDVKLKLE